MTPCMKQEMAECCSMLAESGINSNNGIGNGGIDTGGNEPSAKEFLWDDSDALDD